jgi:hypothetical protein
MRPAPSSSRRPLASWPAAAGCDYLRLRHCGLWPGEIGWARCCSDTKRRGVVAPAKRVSRGWFPGALLLLSVVPLQAIAAGSGLTARWLGRRMETTDVGVAGNTRERMRGLMPAASAPVCCVHTAVTQACTTAADACTTACHLCNNVTGSQEGCNGWCEKCNGYLDRWARDSKDLDTPYPLPLIPAPLLPMPLPLLQKVRVSGRVTMAVVEFATIAYLRCVGESSRGDVVQVHPSHCR